MSNYQTYFISCFTIWEITRCPGKWNLNLLNSFSLLNNLKEMMCSRDKSVEFWRSVGPIKHASKWIFCAFLKSSSFKRTQKCISQLWATLLPTYIFDNTSSHFLMLSGAQYKEIAKTSFWRRPTKNNVLQNISR